MMPDLIHLSKQTEKKSVPFAQSVLQADVPSTTNTPTPTDSLLGLSKEDLESFFSSEGEKPYRAKQVLEWLYQQRVNSIEEMSNLSAAMRDKLASRFHINRLQHVETKGSGDTTRKFLFRLNDGRYVETVFIPASKGLNGRQSSRKTICVSSQVGCAYGCKFCASGLAGFTRNLTAAEIIGQMLSVEQITLFPIPDVLFDRSLSTRSHVG